MTIRRRRRDRPKNRQIEQRRLDLLDRIAYTAIDRSDSASAATWGGTRCPGCGISVRPHWVAPIVIPIGQSGWMYGVTAACDGPGAKHVNCPGERDWW